MFLFDTDSSDVTSSQEDEVIYKEQSQEQELVPSNSALGLTQLSQTQTTSIGRAQSQLDNEDSDDEVSQIAENPFANLQEMLRIQCEGAAGENREHNRSPNSTKTNLHPSAPARVTTNACNEGRRMDSPLDSDSPPRNSIEPHDSVPPRRRLTQSIQLTSRSLPSQVPINSLVTTTKRDKMQRAVISSKSSRTNKMNLRCPKQQDNKLAPVARAKSIVGTRPKHWAGSASSRPVLQTRNTKMSRRQSQLRSFSSNFAQHEPVLKKARTIPSPASAISFAPSFKTRTSPPGISSTSPETDDTTLVMEQDSSLLSSPLLQQLGSPIKRDRHNRNAASGQLTRRLIKLRDARKLDNLRLSSGQYNFSIKRNVNDPRNSKQAFPITVVGPPFPGPERTTLLAFFHSFGKLGWLSLTNETSRAMAPHVGLMLQIYNGVVFPASERLLHMVATQLCEAYPSALPALPSVDTLRKEHYIID